MSEGPNGNLELPKQGAGALFRAEMFLSNFFMGYWKFVAVVVAVVLGALLFFGLYQSQQQGTERGITSRSAGVLDKLVTDLQRPEVELPPISPGQEPIVLEKLDPWMVGPRSEGPNGFGRVFNTPQNFAIEFVPDMDQEGAPERVREAAVALEKIGEEGSGPSSVEAFFYAAELRRLVGDRTEQLALLTRLEPLVTPSLAWPVASGIAQVHEATDKSDEAIAIYKKWMGAGDDQRFGREQAALNLASLYVDLEQNEEAKKTLSEFLIVWPESTMKPVVEYRLKGLGGALPTAAGQEAVDSPTPEGAEG